LINGTETEILICHACEGSGVVQMEEIEDHHNGVYRFWNEICSTCNGSGRRIKIVTIETTIKAYDNPEVAQITFDKLKDK